MAVLIGCRPGSTSTGRKPLLAAGRSRSKGRAVRHRPGPNVAGQGRASRRTARTKQFIGFLNGRAQVPDEFGCLFETAINELRYGS
jgi:hypothetical protein